MKDSIWLGVSYTCSPSLLLKFLPYQFYKYSAVEIKMINDNEKKASGLADVNISWLKTSRSIEFRVPWFNNPNNSDGAIFGPN